MKNILNLPTDKTYYNFIGNDGKSAGIALYNSEYEAKRDLEELQNDGVTLSYFEVIDTTRAIEIINGRSQSNYSFPMDSGDSFFTCNA